MGRVTELIAYLNSKDEKIDKSFTHLTITDKIAQKRHELIRKTKVLNQLRCWMTSVLSKTQICLQ